MISATTACGGCSGGCRNGGIYGKLNKGKQCFCQQCFTGPLCETKIKGCQNPCKNGGVNVKGVCQCAAGFTGPTCTSCIFFFLPFFLPFFLSFF